MADHKILAACTPEYTLISKAKTKLSFNVHLQAPEVEDDEGKRATVALSAVIDTSGSMEGGKLQLVKDSCNFILTQMSARDKIGVVEYNTVVKELFPLSRTSEGFKLEASRVIKKMKAESRTNLSGGLFRGFEQQHKNKFVDWEPQTTKPELEREEPTDTGNALDSASESSSFVDVNMKDEDSFSEASLLDLDPPQDPPTSPTSHTPQAAPPPVPDAAQALSGWKARTGGILAGMKRARAPAAANAFEMRQGRFAPQPPAGLRSGFFGGREAPAEQELEADAVKSVFLFTDGLANEGVTKTDKLVGTLTKLLASARPPIRICTFGVGDDHSPELLGELARAGNGTYYYIEKEEGIATAFADALGGLLSVAAQNVVLEFVPAQGVKTTAVHTAFTTSRTADGASAVAVGDLYAEEGKDVLFEVEFEAAATEGEECEDCEVGVVRLRYLDVVGATLGSEELKCVVRRVKEVPADQAPDAAVAVQRARVETARAMQAAESCAAQGDRASAAQGLRAAMASLSLLEQRQALNECEAQLVAQLHFDCAEAVENVSTAEAYSTRGNKLLWAKMRAHEQQRTCAREEEDEAGSSAAAVTRGPRTTSAAMHSYATPKQMTMRGFVKKSVNTTN